MKKTKHTLLTAITFTAALQAATTANVNAVSEDIDVKVPFNASTQEIQDVYGPAPDYYDGPTTTTAPETMISTLIETTSTTVESVYGPTSVITHESTTTRVTETLYGPPRAYYTGDLNYDDSIDVFDVIYLRKMLINNMKDSGYFGSITLDVNKDGEFGVADLVAMQNYILGRIPDLTTPLSNTTTTTSTATTEPTSTTTIDWSTVVPLYGPPEVLSTYTYPYYTYPTTTTTNRFTDIQLMYGPPRTMPWDDDVFSTVTNNTTTTKKPRKTIVTTTSIETTTTEAITTLDPSKTTVQLMYGPPEYFGLDPDTLKPKE